MNEGPRRRLVVTLDATPESRRVIEAAARLAARLDRELLALFLEDSELLAASGLPVTRIVSFHAGAGMVLDMTAARRALRMAVERAREETAAAAARHRVTWRFALAAELEGELAGELRLDERDLVATGARSRVWSPEARSGWGNPPCPTILIGRSFGPVVVVYEGGPESLAIGKRLALEDGVPLVVLCIASGLATGQDRAEEAKRRLGPMPPARLALLTVESDAPEWLAPAIRTWRPGVVVADTCQTDSRLRAAVAALTATAPRA